MDLENIGGPWPPGPPFSYAYDMRLLTVDESWEHFSSTFTNIMNTCIPQSKPRTYKNIYITRDAIHLKNVKNKLWKRYTRTRLPSDYEAFCTARNELRSYTRLLRHNFELGITNDIKLNPGNMLSLD